MMLQIAEGRGSASSQARALASPALNRAWQGSPALDNTTLYTLSTTGIFHKSFYPTIKHHKSRKQPLYVYPALARKNSGPTSRPFRCRRWVLLMGRDRVWRRADNREMSFTTRSYLHIRPHLSVHGCPP
ncbi:hypothetical protein MIND_01250200 [Mycena indigotica]|uniref:Uncharacterized protein n=1 Tax=Mycena indigotica TaxID=2126181 RepID=A0A8H6S3U8_9AGAR|nr:uncharacterized protein MIND_01250200 [Mycena indigotica]KAF7292228.1 hypothetical protein MIND_01250200 [Mycena indigotica]